MPMIHEYPSFIDLIMGSRDLSPQKEGESEKLLVSLIFISFLL